MVGFISAQPRPSACLCLTGNSGTSFRFLAAPPPRPTRGNTSGAVWFDATWTFFTNDDQWWFAPLIWAGAYAAELMISDPGEGANLGCRRGLNQ